MIFNWLAYLVLEILRWFLIISTDVYVLIISNVCICIKAAFINSKSIDLESFTYFYMNSIDGLIMYLYKYLNYIYICQRHCEKCYKWRILSVDINVWDWSTGKPPVLYNTDDSLPSDAAAWLTKPTWQPLATELKIVGTGTTHSMLLSWILSSCVCQHDGRTQCCWHWLLRLYVPTRRLLTFDL